MSDNIELVIEIPKEAQANIAKIRFLIGGKEDRILQQTIINAIKNGKSLSEEDNKMKWIVKNGCFGYTLRCSKCDAQVVNESKYCPNCGRKAANK